jgi:hypothetical protein
MVQTLSLWFVTWTWDVVDLNVHHNPGINAK